LQHNFRNIVVFYDSAYYLSFNKKELSGLGYMGSRIFEMFKE